MTDITAAIAGLGITEQGKVYGRSARQFAAQAVRLAAGSTTPVATSPNRSTSTTAVW